MAPMVPLNEAIEALSPYPWPRLRSLLAGVEPPPGLATIDLSIGEPKFAVPAMTSPILNEHASEWNRYTAADGTPALRRAIADWIMRRYPLTSVIDPDRHLLPCCGSREALAMSLMIFDNQRCGIKREVLIPDPFYPPYEAAARVAGFNPVYLATSAQTHDLPDLEALRREEEVTGLLTRTVAMFLCNPSNPQGAVASPQYLRDLIALCRRFGIALLVDECYSEIWLDAPPAGALEIADTCDGRFENVMVFNSLSKRSSVPGLRSGFVAGDPALIGVFRRLRSYTCVTMADPVMKLSAALWADEDHVAENRRRYLQNWAAATGRLGQLFPVSTPKAGFFAWLDVSRVGLDGERAAVRLWAETAIKVVPGRFLSGAGQAQDRAAASFIRLALVHPADVIATAMDRLVACLEPAAPKVPT